MQKKKKKMEELNLLDDFMMGTVLSYPGIGEEVCRRMLSVILGQEVKELKIIPQRVYFGVDTDKHGIRLDVYAEETDENGVNTVYDIEPDKNSKKEMRLSLPKRVRFYHAKIDADTLESGADYSQLKRVMIIFISPYDPFGLNRMVYTVQNRCVEEPEMPYDDGSKTIFLYTNGNKGNPPEELRKLLRYLEDSRAENAGSKALQEIHQMVETVRHDKEVSLEYMKVYEWEQMIRAEGKEEGKEEGLLAGKEAGALLGAEKRVVSLIRKNMEKNVSVSDIADFLDTEPDYVRGIIDLIGKNPAADDEEIARESLDRFTP